MKLPREYVLQINNEIESAFADPKLSKDEIKSFVLQKVQTLNQEQDFISEVMSELYQIKDWDTAINSVLAKSGEHLHVSRIFIMERIGESRSIVLKYLWHEEEYPSKSGITLPQDVSEHLFEYFLNHDHYLIDSQNDAYSEYQAYLHSLDILSCLIFPIKMHDKIYGFIGLDECTNHRAWTDEDIRQTRVLSEIVSHAILQKRTQMELNQSNEILNNVLDSIHAIIVAVDIETNRILYLNQYAKNVFGEVCGQLCWEQLHGDLKSPCENCPRPGTGQYKNETVVIKEIQNSYWKRWYHTTNTLINWLDGKKAHLEIAIDITDRVETEERMQFTTKRLEDLNRTKDKFFSIVAHDLKNPLYSLMGFAEIIRNSAQQLSPEEIREYSDLIYQSARNTHQLLQNLMTWSQSQTGKLRYHPVSVDLTQLLDNAVEFIKPIAKQKSILIQKDYQIASTLTIDPNMITAAVRNLLANAVKFTQVKGKINVKLSAEKGYTCIAIEDNGIGLSEEDISKLFRIDIDHRSIGKAHTEEKGTGLGLILVKEFVSLHGGKIEVKSTEGSGSVFCIYLPDTSEE